MATTALTVPIDDSELIDSDGEPLESFWHVMAIWFLVEQVRCHLRHRRDFFAGGNMFIYYSAEQARNRDYRGPGFFFVDRVADKPPRRYWAIWHEEYRFPDVIIELSSPSTKREDHTTKKEIYERTFRTPAYFIYDPDATKLVGWHLVADSYETLVPNDRGRLWCEPLQLWLGPWQGAFQGMEAVWPRFYDKNGNVLPTFAEVAAEEAAATTRQASAQQAQAALEEARAARKQAEDQCRRAEDERRRAEEELAKLRAKLSETEKPSPEA